MGTAESEGSPQQHAPKDVKERMGCTGDRVEREGEGKQVGALERGAEAAEGQDKSWKAGVEGTGGSSKSENAAEAK